MILSDLNSQPRRVISIWHLANVMAFAFAKFGNLPILSHRNDTGCFLCLKRHLDILCPGYEQFPHRIHTTCSLHFWWTLTCTACQYKLESTEIMFFFWFLAWSTQSVVSISPTLTKVFLRRLLSRRVAPGRGGVTMTNNHIIKIKGFLHLCNQNVYLCGCDGCESTWLSSKWMASSTNLLCKYLLTKTWKTSFLCFSH